MEKEENRPRIFTFEGSHDTIYSSDGKVKISLDMIKTTDVFNINFYKKEVFHGSCGWMRYRIAKKEEEDRKNLQVTLWPGPYNYDTTADEMKVRAEFAYSNDGLKEAVAYLNAQYEKGLVK